MAWACSCTSNHCNRQAFGHRVLLVQSLTFAKEVTFLPSTPTLTRLSKVAVVKDPLRKSCLRRGRLIL